MSVIGLVTISSPGSGSIAAIAVWTAAVPDAQAYTCFTPSLSANSCSSFFTNLPFVLVRVPLAITSDRLVSSS